MAINSTRSRVDDQRKDHIDTKAPKQRNSPKQSYTHNLPTNDVENINSTSKGRGLLLANNPWVVPWRIERMLQTIQRHSRITFHRSHILNVSKTIGNNLAMTWIDHKKAYDMVPYSWIINSLKMYKISEKVVNFVDKTMKT